MAPRKPLTVRSRGDFVLGVVYACLACVALFLLKDLSAGTASSMGPAYFPRMLAIILIVLSAAMIVKSLFVGAEHELRMRLPPIVFVIGGTVFFGASPSNRAVRAGLSAPWRQASLHPPLSAADQRQGGTLHPVGAARMGVRDRLSAISRACGDA